MLSRFLALLVLLLASARGAEPAIPPGWKIFTQWMPAFIFFDSSSGERRLAAGIRLHPHSRSQEKGMRLFDVKEWMARITGVAIPDGAVVLLDEESSTVVVIAPEEVIEVAELIVTHRGGGGSEPHVQVTATLAEFSVQHPAKMRDLPYERLRSVAGNTWREVEEIVVSTKSGQRATARRREGDVPREPRPPQDLPQWTPPLAPGEAGAALEVEPVIGPDGETVDLNVAWHRRLGQEEKAQQLETTTSMTIKDGSAIVAGRWPVDPRLSPNTIGPVRSYVLVVRVDLVNSEGVPLREAFAAAVRKLREQAKAKGLPAR